MASRGYRDYRSRAGARSRGLVAALAAEVGSRAGVHTLDDIRARYASVQAYQVGQAAAAAHRLQTARSLVIVAIALLLTGVLLTWWAPAASPTAPSYLEVARPGGTICGTPESADDGVLRLAVAGSREYVVIPLTAVTGLAVTAACP